MVLIYRIPRGSLRQEGNLKTKIFIKLKKILLDTLMALGVVHSNLPSNNLYISDPALKNAPVP